MRKFDRRDKIVRCEREYLTNTRQKNLRKQMEG